jgi:DNA invertase Pin-like site-specific DNA recombinase
LFGNLAELERALVAERTRDALRHKIKKGESTGRVPFGSQLATDGKTLLPDPNEQRAIQLMQEWRGDGWPLRSIANELKRLGIRGKNGKPLGPTTIRCILNRVSKHDAA